MHLMVSEFASSRFDRGFVASLKISKLFFFEASYTLLVLALMIDFDAVLHFVVVLLGEDILMRGHSRVYRRGSRPRERRSEYERSQD